MKKRFLKWWINIFPRGEVSREFRKKIRTDFPGYHLAKNGSGRKKSVPPEVRAAKEFYKKEEERQDEST